MKFRWLLLLLVLPFSCKEKYMPDLNVPAAGYLVVEGFINVGNGATNITLTRSSGLDSSVRIPESGAQLEVEAENGAVYPLVDSGAGNYTIEQVPAVPGQRYRLHIKRESGKEYVSDYSTYKITPEIDSINWNSSSEQVYIYVNTHDVNNQSIYYQWQFDETWEYHSAFSSQYKYENGKIEPRGLDELIFTCWISDVSTSIAIASSAKLQADVISQFLLTKVPILKTHKFESEYSILVKQHAISKEWYEWTEKIKKNTEQLGSIFDAQPSEAGGNFHCISDPGESVVGFVGCTSETNKRIFIHRQEIPVNQIDSRFEDCKIDTIYTADYPNILTGGSVIPIYMVFRPFSMDWIGMGVSKANCVDCRLQGGVSVKPDFWQ